VVIQKLTLNNMLTNPAGKYSAQLANRSVIIANLENRYFSIIQKNKFLKMKIYKNSEEKYTFHIKVPSEREMPNKRQLLFYDVILEFTKSSHETSAYSLYYWDMRIWSNSPSMVFTYMYVLEQNDLYPKYLKSKTSKESLTIPPLMRNPVEMIGFEKTVFFACNYIRRNSLYKIQSIKPLCFKFDIKKILSSISSTDEKLIEISNIINKNKKTKKNIKRKKVVSTLPKKK
jgi:hypothetical protein